MTNPETVYDLLVAVDLYTVAARDLARSVWALFASERVAILVYFSLVEKTTPNIERPCYFPIAIPGGTKERCPLSAEVRDPSK